MEGGGVRTDGGEGVVLLGHHHSWVWDHCQPCALAIHQWGVVLSMGTGGGSFPGHCWVWVLGGNSTCEQWSSLVGVEHCSWVLSCCPWALGCYQWALGC